MLETLDVGCGGRPVGDVNVDLNPKAVNLTVKCDVQHLPFKSNSFAYVVCHHVIEHVYNPYLLLKELIRVAKGHLVITCPYKLSRMAKRKMHKHYFNRQWFWKQLAGYHVGYEVQLVWSSIRSIFQVPIEVHVDIWKPRG